MGSVDEVRSLARRYHGVTVWLPDDVDTTRLSPTALAGYDVLHFAGHTLTDDQHPWRSGVLLGASATQADPFLRASEFAGMRLGARLAVMSGCASAGGQVWSGEGVQGLSSALLGTGVPCVIATSWPVSDASAAEVVRRLYGHLEAGHTVASALRDAQRDVRRLRATQDPFHWAGFVVIGDGNVRVPLERRVPWAGMIGFALVAVGTTGWAMRRAWQRRTSSGSAGGV
jgi:CHAT domain-containing protein